MSYVGSCVASGGDDGEVHVLGERLVEAASAYTSLVRDACTSDPQRMPTPIRAGMPWIASACELLRNMTGTGSALFSRAALLDDPVEPFLLVGCV